VVFADALSSIGTLLTPGNAQRDAVHLAVLRVVAAEQLSPNQDIGVLADGRASALATTRVGKVDPFLTTLVQRGETFWMVLYPGRITSLRHVWRHPLIPNGDCPLASAHAAMIAAATAAAAAATATTGTDANSVATVGSDGSGGDRRSVQTDAELGRLVKNPGPILRDAVHWAVCPVTAAERLFPNQDVGFLPSGRVASESASVQALGKIDPFLTNIVEAGQMCWFVVYPGQIRSLFHAWEHPALLLPSETPDVPKAEPSGSSASSAASVATVATGAEPSISGLLARVAIEAKVTAPAALASAPETDTDHDSEDEEAAEKKEAALSWISDYAVGFGLSSSMLLLAAEEYLESNTYFSGGDVSGCYVSDEFWDHFEVVKGRSVSYSDRRSFFTDPSSSSSQSADTC